jgi:hypothetical protein
MIVSPNDDLYELPTSKHWRIIHHIHDPKYELSHEFLNYIKVHRSWSVQSLNTAEAIQKSDTRWYKGLHWALRCEVLDGSSELGLPADFPVLGWVTIGPHELATSHVVLSYFCNQKDPQKTWATKIQQHWPINVAINSQLLVCKASKGRALYYDKPALRVSPYFQVLALFKSFRNKGTSYSNHTRVANN